MPPDSSKPIVIQGPKQARELRAFGDVTYFHLEGKHTGGLLTVWTNITPPGGGPPPHYHANEDEWFFVKEGRAGFLVDGQWSEAAVGSMIFVPRGSVHTFKNLGDTPLNLEISTSPSGFEHFFEQCAEVFAAGGEPDIKRVFEIGARHGIHFV